MKREEILSEALLALGIPPEALPPGFWPRLDGYLETLSTWQGKINLTALQDERSWLVKHFADALRLLPLVPAGAALLDVGTGAGFPGMVLKLARPDLRLTLLEATRKKVFFLRALSDRLRLPDVEIHHGRAGAPPFPGEGHPRPGAFDVVTARGVAPLPELLPLLAPYRAPTGRLIAMKGPRGDEELAAGERVCHELGLICVERIAYTLPPPGGERLLLCFA